MNELTTKQSAGAIAPQAHKVTLVDIRRNPKAFPRIKEYPTEDLIKHLQSAILGVYQYRGQKPVGGAEEIKTMSYSLMAELLADDFGNDTKELSMEEIRMALRKVGLRQGSDMYGINVGSLYNAIVEFRKTEVEEARQAIAAERRNPQKIGCSQESIISKYAAMMQQANKERGKDMLQDFKEIVRDYMSLNEIKICDSDYVHNTMRSELHDLLDQAISESLKL